MKKKLFLVLIPAIMALSACAGAAPQIDGSRNDEPKSNESQNNVEQFDLFEEDTLIHEELFEQSASAFINKEIMKLPYVDETGPKIGVQSASYKVGNEDFKAIRFVAAINLDGKVLSDVNIVWDRAVYTDGGAVHNGIIGVKTAEKIYETIYDGNDQISAPSGYTHFVTYTVRNVPAENDNYVVTASLLIDGVSNNKVCASSIDLERQVSFDKGTTGYFLTGTFNNKPGVVKNLDKLRGDNDKAAFARHLKAGDSFLAVKNKPDENSFKIYPNTIVNNTDLFTVTEYETNNKIVANNDGDIVFFFSNDGTLYTGTVWFYLSGNMNSWATNTDNASGYIFSYNEEADSFELNVSLAVDNKFGVRVRVDNNHNARWWQGKYSWLNAGFAIADDNNYIIDTAGTYTARLYLDDALNPLGLEKEGIVPRQYKTNIYVIGAAVGDEHGGWGNPLDNTYLFDYSSTEGYKYELKNASLKVGEFKISTYGTWNYDRWQWNGYYFGDSRVADDNIVPTGNYNSSQIDCCANWWEWNIDCKSAGRYDIFVKNDSQLEINYLGE